MNTYTIYNKTTGKIKCIYGGTEPDLQLKPDEEYLEAEYRGDLYYIKSGVPVTYPDKPDSPFIEFDYTSETWIDPRTSEQKLAYQNTLNIQRRKKELESSDWVVVRAMDRGEPVPPDWQVYRQALRDVTDQPDPFNVVWPVKPV